MSVSTVWSMVTMPWSPVTARRAYGACGSRWSPPGGPPAPAAAATAATPSRTCGGEQGAELMVCEGHRLGAAEGAVCVWVESEHGDLDG